MSTATVTVDPNVSLPPAVRMQIENANSIYSQMMTPPPPPSPEEPDAAAKQPDPAPQPEPAKQPDPASQPEPAKTPETDWERRFKALKGRYDAEIGPLRQQIRAASEEIAALREELAKKPVQPTQPVQLITPKEQEEYGAEFLEVVGKKAQEVVHPIVQKYEAEISELKNTLTSVSGNVAMTKREQLLSHLDAKIPDWRAQNTDPDFLSWLHQPDVYTGQIRRDLLDNAYKSNDAVRVAAFFEGFRKEAATVAPKGKATEEPVTQPGKPSLETFAAPGRAKSAAPPSPAEKPTITRAEIAKFYADVAAGRYRGNEAEKAKFERQIFEAQADQRIK